MTAPDLTRAAWRKSSYSEGSNACIEVGIRTMSSPGTDALYLMRDSKDPEGPALALNPGQWHALLRDIKGTC
ncbi:DUF397 domain-containing protein [Actinomadura sp. 6N118]|uniref:DUF397 domain-containing protein n=1 Tax=Actinomadura sp. 6N118 TaxID=3375151 RepID=UPI0037B5D082